MASVVRIIGITHNPFMPRLFGQADRPPGATPIMERIGRMRHDLAEARPDVLVMVGNDHLHQFFMDNMPCFMVGNAAWYPGTFFDEEREFGLPQCRVPGHRPISRAVLEGCLEAGVDIAYSNELRLDHSIVVPLLWLHPSMELPVVPVLTNTIAPPLPRARRFVEVGQVIRGVLDTYTGAERIAVVVSGHLSLEVGGPRQHEPRVVDADFDREAVRWIAEADVAGACSAATYDRLKTSGNMTHGFLNFLLAMGIASGTRPQQAEMVDAGFPAVPFFYWNLEKGDGA